MLTLSHSLRAASSHSVAIVGAGGKTSALFQLARELAPSLVTTTTHLGSWQIALASHHFVLRPADRLPPLPPREPGVALITGPLDAVSNRFSSPTPEQLAELGAFSHASSLPLLVEADGARQKPLKAPAWHEPAIPHFVDLVITCAGLTALGHPLTDEWVHRSEIFARLADLPSGATITAQAVVRVLACTDGGLKSVPEAARRVVLLNQASSPELQAQAARMAGSLLDSFAAVVVASLDRQMVLAVHERTAGIVLAAGESKRFGRPKQLLDFHGRPFVRATAEAALAAGLDPVIVVTGANAEQVEMALAGLPVQITRNEGWQSGQASSVRVGLRALGLLPFPTPAAADPVANDGGWDRVGAAIFLLADQPQVTADVLRALVEFHAREMPFVASPMVEDRRANPTLFDRTTFPELVQLAGEEGGRALFSKYPPVYLPWLDPGLLRDVDTPADYERLIGHE